MPFITDHRPPTPPNPPPPPTAAQIAAGNSNWVRAAESRLQCLQADIDAVHLHLHHAGLTSSSSSSSSSSDADATHDHRHVDGNGNGNGNVAGGADAAGEPSVDVDRILALNGKIMRLLQQVWFVGLNGLFDEQMVEVVGRRIVMVVGEWKLLKMRIVELLGIDVEDDASEGAYDVAGSEGESSPSS